MRAPVEITVLAAAAAAGIGMLGWLLRKSRRDPREMERRRCVLVSREGRMGDGYITDVSDTAVFYTYEVNGVEYAASQDIAAIRDRLPEDLNTLIGPVTIKFLLSSPENSIVVSEDWFGIRRKGRRMQLKGA